MHNGNNKIVEICKQYGTINKIFDCGSRDGLDGIYLANKLNADELHVFEPNPESANVCRENLIKSSGFKWVMNEVAVSDTHGTVDFYVNDKEKTATPHPNGNPGASSMFLADPNYPHEKYSQIKISVPSITLAEYIENNGAPDLLWMDLQGAEKIALLGMKAHILKISIIHIEVGFRPVYIGQPLFWDIDGLLRSFGFKLIDLDAGRWPTWILPFYRFFGTGPWVANAVYIKDIHRQESVMRC
jgi:FkbM family methyltransferase